MAYEVIKLIKGHRYRYRVESYRDRESGKIRNRWQYVGRVDGLTEEDKAGSSKIRGGAAQTRERIVQAFLHLMQATTWDKVGASAIAAGAGVALTTFYRHFRNRNELLRLCAERANEELDAKLNELTAIAASADLERERVRNWAIDVISHPPGPATLFRVWAEGGYEWVKDERHEMRVRAFCSYFKAIAERGYISLPADVQRLAVALSVIVQLFTRRSVLEDALLSDDEFAAIAESFDRLIFR